MSESIEDSKVLMSTLLRHAVASWHLLNGQTELVLRMPNLNLFRDLADCLSEVPDTSGSRRVIQRGTLVHDVVTGRVAVVTRLDANGRDAHLLVVNDVIDGGRVGVNYIQRLSVLHVVPDWTWDKLRSNQT